MTIREQKQIIFYLNTLLEFMPSWEPLSMTKGIASLFTKDELIECIDLIYTGVYRKEYLQKLKKQKCLCLIGDQHALFSFILEKWKSELTEAPQYTQEEVSDFFKRTQSEDHYLASKPVLNWDQYDRTIYGKKSREKRTTKEVFFICTERVISEKAFAVTRSNQYFFDTYEEAEEHLHQSSAIGDFKSDTLHILKLYLLT